MRDKESINQGIAKFFLNMRLNRNLSKMKMADLLYMDTKTWSRYESGQTCPSVGEFLWICNYLNEDALKPILEIIYPDSYQSGCSESQIIKIRETMCHYFANVASDKSVEQWNLITLGHHGSSVEAQIQEFSAIEHLPIKYRLVIAKLVRACWDIAAASNELINTDQVMPNIELLDYAISRCETAIKTSNGSYTTIL